MSLLVLALVGTAAFLALGPDEPADPVAAPVADPSATPLAPASPAAPTPTPTPTTAATPARATLPHGGRAVFEGDRFLVAYYGTAGSGALGVLGEDRPALMHRRLVAAAAPFARPGQPVQPVYELIVTIADATPGPDGDYHHDIDRRAVQRYIDAAHRHGALVLLDIQPGHADFLTVARRWAWALRDPYVGLALDPEWRMPRGEVPGRVIGHVRAAEVNRTSAWLARLVARHDLPQKLFVLHQFRGSMLPDLERVRARRGLVMVQHADGFGTRSEKLASYRAITRPRQFTMGWKLFYDEDVDRMGAAAVHQVRPRVRFVSFQ
ncbi:hypothetical protein [Nocardioides ochotonae]|uniref:hypothetical protein n=1 Tax=Nocardioides ochotonae TaxID=2685869 RepID=UPI0014074B5C|nr:hypothetical protein [Nocardioides ochotonae]